MGQQEHKATARALNILEYLSNNSEGHTLTEIANALDAPKSSIWPILHTLESHGFIRTSPQNANHYCIGPYAFIVGSAYSSNLPFYEYLNEKMKKMVAIIDETSQLAILSENDVLYLLRSDSKNPITLRSQIEKRLPAYCTGLGKALLSQFSLEELKKRYPDGLKIYTPQTLPTVEALYQQILETRQTGFSYEHSELVEGVHCVAVPLYNGPNLIAAVSFSMPAYRATEEKIKLAQNLLMDFKRDVEGKFARFHISSGLDII